MKGNFHVRFLEGSGLATACSHSINSTFFTVRSFWLVASSNSFDLQGMKLDTSSSLYPSEPHLFSSATNSALDRPA